MKLVAEYSYPMNGTSVNNFFTFPIVNEKKAIAELNKFIDEAIKRFNIPGFKMSIQLDEPDNG